MGLHSHRPDRDLTLVYRVVAAVVSSQGITFMDVSLTTVSDGTTV